MVTKYLTLVICQLLRRLMKGALNLYRALSCQGAFWEEAEYKPWTNQICADCVPDPLGRAVGHSRRATQQATQVKLQIDQVRV